MNLYPHQETGIALLRDALRRGFKRPVLQLPTGSGKTKLAIAIIQGALEKGKRVAFIVDRLELINQTSRELFAHGIDHGVIQGMHELTNYRKPVQVCSIQTMARRRQQWVCDLMIIDEAHAIHTAHVNLLKRWNAIPAIGLTATPWTKGMGLVYDTLIKPVDISYLIENGYLVDADIYAPSAPDMTGVSMVGGDFNGRQTAERVRDKTLVANIFDTWATHAKGKQTLVMASNVAHSKQIAETFNLVGEKAHHIDAYTDTDERRRLIDGFKAGEIRILSSVGVLTTGFDAPNAECLILARPTASRMLHIQMIGRVLRKCEGKEKAIILDHAGNFERNGMHTDSTPDELDTTSKGEKGKQKEKIKDEDLPKVCKKCHVIKPPKTHVCPNCGYAPERQNDVFESDGTLVKISSADKRNRTETWAEKIAFIAGVKYIAEQKGWKPGAVAHIYFARYNVWPKDPRVKNAAPAKPSADVLSFIKHRNIKSSHARQNQANQEQAA